MRQLVNKINHYNRGFDDGYASGTRFLWHQLFGAAVSGALLGAFITALLIANEVM